MSLKGRSVLVTGGTGFIGGRLVETLHREHGCRIRVLVRNFSNVPRIAPFPVELVSGDLRDPGSVERAVRGCEVVFHCAHDFGPTLGGQRRTGVAGTRNLAEAAIAHGVERFVHVSSVAVYQPLPAGDVTEASPRPPSRDPYVLVKREAESLISALHRERGLPAVVLQPTIVYGPFSSFWTLNLVRRLRSGLVPLLDGGEAICNAVYVDDVVESLILAATVPGVEGETCLVSGAEPVTWKAFYRALEAVAGTESVVEMSVEEVRRRIRERERKGHLSSRIMRRARDRRTWSRLGQLPVLRTIRRALPDRLLSMAADRWLEEAGNGGGRSIVLPSEPSIEAQTSRGRVRVDRAKEVLGYAPRFDLERGMEVTGRYLEWANLVGRIGPIWR